MKHSPIRPDIQFLRGIAILAVLVYHSELISLSGGYLGVDIFFVISGYLITSLILRDLSSNQFSFFQFYARRAKRLLPAAYCTLIFVTLLSFKVLTKSQWDDFIKQLIGTATFTANIVLPFQTGYFETTSAQKPLLHTWSLSVEEQYYLFIPLILFVIKPKWHFASLVTGAMLSLFICIFFVSFPFSYWRFPTIDSETAAFFLLPTRAWEMLAGSILAWLMMHSSHFKLPNIARCLAVILIFFLCAFPIDSVHPRENAILVVIATAIIIAGEGHWLPQNRMTLAIEKIGDWSYSLYLIHWPLFALSRSAYLGETPKHIKFLLICISIVLAYLQYEYIEQRFRYGWQANKTKTFKWLAAATCIVIIAPMAGTVIREFNSSTNLDYMSMPNFGLKETCAAGKIFSNQKECETADQPIYAVWGDSYSMHLIPGLKLENTIGKSMIQVTKAACAPILGVASIDSNYNEIWAKGCLDFNEKAINFIQNSQSIKYVIMGSPYSGYFDYGNLTLFFDGKKIIGSRSIAVEQMITTIERLRAFGKQPILVAPPPRPGFNIGECWERKSAGLLVLGRSNCNFLIEEYYAFQRGIIDGLNEVQRRTHVDIVWFDKIICDTGVCQTMLADGISIYKDGGHLTVPGSEWLVPKLDLIRMAR
ncbi:MAG: acyltransferase [Methylococcaceae bacterium]|nr:acyltransferase [Methylococcaceae bacterium]